MKKPSAATVIATLALFVALGGTGYAAVALEPNSVGTAQLKEGAVQSSDIRDGAVGSSDIANGAISSDDIKAGSIQVSDLSKGAMNGLDGKDGAQGPAGPAGPTGPAGPAGPAGSSSGDGGGASILDADGNAVSGALLVPAPDADPWTGAVNTFYRSVNGSVWRVNSDGAHGKKYVREVIFFLSADCSGPAYVQATATTNFGAVSAGTELQADYNDFPVYTVSSTTVHHVAGDPVSGYDSNPHVPAGTDTNVSCSNNTWVWNERTNEELDVRLLTPMTPPSLDGPFTFDRG